MTFKKVPRLTRETSGYASRAADFFLLSDMPLMSNQRYEAMKIDEYIPMMRPTRSASEKPRIDSAPKMYKAMTVNNTVTTVLI